ncbi:MAG TPA: alpha/beta fold hydrolase [Streptosporangiaceae bacterium]|jgi:hypothetical protein
MATFVLVPGGWHGSWSFEAVTPLLQRAGHAVHALTLTGLRPDDDNAAVATANLDTHAATCCGSSIAPTSPARRWSGTATAGW